MELPLSEIWAASDVLLEKLLTMATTARLGFTQERGNLCIPGLVFPLIMATPDPVMHCDVK